MTAERLSETQRARLARQMRVLAMECVAGTAPPFGVGSFGTMRRPICALGHARSRARVRDIGDIYLEHDDLVCLVEEANDVPNDVPERHAALPFPLLALATALDGKDI